MTDAILVLNAGSSSLKFALFEADSLDRLYRGQVEDIGADAKLKVVDADGDLFAERALPEASNHGAALAHLIERKEARLGHIRFVAAGHRVVHGGERFAGPAMIDAELLAYLHELSPLAPLHQPHNLAAIEAVARQQPDLPQVACFDTAFHRTQPEIAQAFALPHKLTESGIIRYGFHGLSYAYIASALPDILGKPAETNRVVVAHLGHGASMAALRGGRSIAATTGFTALEGLPMGKRSGSLDPGIVLYLMQEQGMDVDAVTDLLYRRSGLLGVSGISDDMEELLASDDPQAKKAIDLFVYRIGRELGSLTAALGGLDALVFTGGIGEHAAPIRKRVCEDAAWLGLRLDPAANDAGKQRISDADSRVSALVIPTNEERVVAGDTKRLIMQRT